MNVQVIGFSTSGKTTMVDALKEEGYEVIYNMPSEYSRLRKMYPDPVTIDPKMWDLFIEYITPLEDPKSKFIRRMEARMELHLALEREPGLFVWSGGLVHKLISTAVCLNDEKLKPFFKFNDLIDVWPAPQVVVNCCVTEEDLRRRQEERRFNGRNFRGSIDNQVFRWNNWNRNAGRVLSRLEKREVKVVTVGSASPFSKDSASWRYVLETLNA